MIGLFSIFFEKKQAPSRVMNARTGPVTPSGWLHEDGVHDDPHVSGLERGRIADSVVVEHQIEPLAVARRVVLGELAKVGDVAARHEALGRKHEILLDEATDAQHHEEPLEHRHRADGPVVARPRHPDVQMRLLLIAVGPVRFAAVAEEYETLNQIERSHSVPPFSRHQALRGPSLFITAETKSQEYVLGQKKRKKPE